MNVLVMMLDSLRPDFLGCGGHGVVQTPHIDRIAAEGILFRNAYAEYPITVPSRTALVSGNYTFTNRPWCPLRNYDMHIAEVLHGAGFLTAAFSDTPFQENSNMHRGFDVFRFFPEGKCHKPVADVDCDIPHAYYPDFAPEAELHFFPNTIKNRHYALKTYGRACPELLFDSAIEWLEEHHDEDFFLWIDSFEPHEPWCPPPPYDTMYRSREPERYIPFPVGPSSDWMTAEDRRHVLENYMGDVTHTDEQVGNVMEALETLGIKDRTLVFVLSDHGEPFGEHGTVRKYGVPVYDELAKMVFVVRLPGLVQRGVVSDALVQNVDFATTLADVLELPLPPRKGEVVRADKRRPSITHDYDGVSLVPLLRGEADEVREAAFIGGFGLRAGIRKGPWKMIDNRGEKPNELFNLDEDPEEKRNLFEHEANLARELHRRLWQFQARWNVSLAWRDKPVGQA
ncbi:MAG: sulfatase [Candidatus Brocadiae bacterium]|nr:sulfatase [Candidatus Brocadiia bacterium]